VFDSDGAIVAPRSILIAPSRDCPYVIGVHAETGTVVALHAGRDQIFTNTECVACTSGIIASGIRVFTGQGVPIQEVEFLVIGGITGEHFKHDTHPHRERIREMFTARCGEAVFVDTATLALDLRRVIVHELLRHGAQKQRIKIDQTCPYTNPTFGSKRWVEDNGEVVTSRILSNWVIVSHP
jgi:copper oxidase (laccase) domain-containing protein